MHFCSDQLVWYKPQSPGVTTDRIHTVSRFVYHRSNLVRKCDRILYSIIWKGYRYYFLWFSRAGFVDAHLISGEKKKIILYVDVAETVELMMIQFGQEKKRKDFEHCCTSWVQLYCPNLDECPIWWTNQSPGAWSINQIWINQSSWNQSAADKDSVPFVHRRAGSQVAMLYMS